MASFSTLKLSMQSEQVISLINALAEGKPRKIKALVAELGLQADARAWQQALAEVGLDAVIKGSQISMVQLDILNSERVRKSYAESSELGNAQLHLKPITGSTNTDLMAKTTPCTAAEFLLTEFQASGRGRRQGAWVMPYAAGLALSMRRNFQQPVAALSGLSLVAGMAVVECLNRLVSPKLALKWPNDIVVQNEQGLSKLGGILVEVVAESGQSGKVVTGIGLNYRFPSKILAGLDQAATQLFDLLPESARNRSYLLGQLLAALELAYAKFEQHGFAAFRKQWQAYDALYDQDLVVKETGREVLARACGISETGALLVDMEGQRRELVAADISVRLSP